MAVPTKRTDLDIELMFGIDTKHRRISFGTPMNATVEEGSNAGDFNQMSVEMAVRAIRRMQEDHPQKPIEIYMNSFGGDPYSMMYLVDAILTSTCQFKFFGGGSVMSSATWVMCVCDERYLYPNTTVMLHDGNDVFNGKIRDIKINAKESTRLMERLYDIYAENSRMPKKFYEEICGRDLYLTSEETIMLGLADFIVPYQKRGNLRKRRLSAMADVPASRSMKSLVKKLFDRVETKVSVKEFNINSPTIDESDPNIIVDNTPVPDIEPSEEFTNIDELITKE